MFIKLIFILMTAGVSQADMPSGVNELREDRSGSEDIENLSHIQNQETVLLSEDDSRVSRAPAVDGPPIYNETYNEK